MVVGLNSVPFFLSWYVHGSGTGNFVILTYVGSVFVHGAGTGNIFRPIFTGGYGTFTSFLYQVSLVGPFLGSHAA